ncbi:FAD-dependent oxidoreductase [Paenibacillus sp. GCM10023252]|uniref:FAD-dependent oxidoreductase n=1 Tax=Paenibacillus sp. GCM10023252 TaxID=3252649 RepID=UPI0036144F85
MPSANQYDVIVAGLGTAGAIAAIMAARKGMRVLGIDRMHGLGGTGTLGGVLGYYFGQRGGLFEEVDDEVKRMLGEEHFLPCTWLHGDVKMMVLEKYALETGVELALESTVFEVLREGSQVEGIRYIGPDGIHTAYAKLVIDCTGDAEVSVMAGSAVERGRASDGQAQPFSNVALTLKGGRVEFTYTDCGYIQQESGADYTRAVVDSSLMPFHLWDTYTDQPRLLKTAPLLGIREGRFVQGEEKVTFSSYLNDEYTNRPLFYAYSNLDNHSKDVAFESRLQIEWSVAASLWGLNFAVPIPAGALIPKGVDGLLVAGRCLSIDHDMSPCVRMKRDMQKSGEAAGLLAAESILRGIHPREVPYEVLEQQLTESGCLDRNIAQFKEAVGHDDSKNTPKQWLTHAAEIRAGLSGDKPGIAIWSARRLAARTEGNGQSESMLNRLKEWVNQQEDEQLRRNSALALGLAGSEAALPVLRQMVRERDPYMPRTSRKYNSVRGYAALYLLGSLKDKESAAMIIELLQDPASFVFDSKDVEFIANNEEYYFQYVSMGVIALEQIGDAHPDIRPVITEGLRQLIGHPEFEVSVTMKGGNNLKYSLTERVQSYTGRILEGWEHEGACVVN